MKPIYSCINQCFPSSYNHETWKYFPFFNLPLTSHRDHVLWINWELLSKLLNNHCLIFMFLDSGSRKVFRKTISISWLICFKVCCLRYEEIQLSRTPLPLIIWDKGDITAFYILTISCMFSGRIFHKSSLVYCCITTWSCKSE